MLSTRYFVKCLLSGFRHALRASWIYEWRTHLGALADPQYAFFVIYTSAVLGCVVMLFTSLASAMRQPPNSEIYRLQVALIAPGSGALAGLWPYALYRRELNRKQSLDHGDLTYRLGELSRIIMANVQLAVGLFWYGWTVHTLTSPVAAIVGNAWAVFAAVSSLILTAKFMSTTFDEAAQQHSTPLILMFGSLVSVTFSLVEQQVRQNIGFGATSSLFAGLMLTCGVIMLIARTWHRPVFTMSRSLHPTLDSLSEGEPENRV